MDVGLTLVTWITAGPDVGFEGTGVLRGVVVTTSHRAGLIRDPKVKPSVSYHFPSTRMAVTTTKKEGR